MLYTSLVQYDVRRSLFPRLSSHWEICNLPLLLGPSKNVYECFFYAMMLRAIGDMENWKTHTCTVVNTGNISITHAHTHTETHNKQHSNTFPVVYIKAAPLNILMLINVFFHFYFACAGDVLQMRCSLFARSFIRSLVRSYICFCGAFVILHDRIFASCHQSHAIFRLYSVHNVYVYVYAYVSTDFTLMRYFPINLWS